LREKELTLTVVNPHVSEPRDTQIAVRGARLKSAKATVLSHSDIHAHNSFDQRNVVTPIVQSAEIKGDVLNFQFPAASVTKLAVQLA
jgi:alpha-N-arabinofuranosidase